MPPEHKAQLQTSTTELGQPFFTPTSLDDEDSSYDPIEPLSSMSLAALRRLAGYKPPPDPYTREGRAGVLVALFGSRTGKNLNVLLTTRSEALRSFPGQVALPGGKMDDEDINLEATARREAFEEVGLPANPDSIRYLTSLPPFLSRSLLLVTPVVVIVLDSSLKPELNAAEVTEIFSFPLAGFLSHSLDTLDSSMHKSVPPSVVNGQAPYHLSQDYGWFEGVPHRYHHFEAKPRPITGLTAEILIHVAQIAYGRPPDFDVFAEGEWEQPKLVEAAKKDPKWRTKAKKAEVKL